MILTDTNIRIWLYREATDMRKSFAGLITLVKNQLHEDPLTGHLFVFINRRKTQMKVLYYSQGGFCIWMKKLTQGCFAISQQINSKNSLTWHELQCLVDGVEFSNIKYRKRHVYQPTAALNPL
jgi:transposase